MRSLIISIPPTSPLLFPIYTHPVIHKQQPIRHVYSYIRSLFIGIDVPLPPLKQAIITTHQHQHKLHLTYTHSDRYILQRTQQLCTKVGLLCDTLSFIPPVSTSTSTSTPNKHVIDLELLPDEFDDDFLQPQPVGTLTPIPTFTTTPTSTSTTHKSKQRNKKHVRIKTSRNLTYYIPKEAIESTSTPTSNFKSRSRSSSRSPLTSTRIPTPTTVPISQHYITTPTISFAEWEKLSPEQHLNLHYTFCIQCEKPIHHKYWYEHGQIHVQQHNKTKTIATTASATSTPNSTSTITPTSTPTPPAISPTIPQSPPSPSPSPPPPTITTATTTTPKTTRRTSSSSLSTTTSNQFVCPFDGCQHRFNPNTHNFVRDLNNHIDSYHDDMYTYNY